jgi:hypothetical protein
MDLLWSSSPFEKPANGSFEDALDYGTVSRQQHLQGLF